MGQPRYLCIHGHFYQPPRENPWLEAVEVQDSAAPFHDWNERVTRQCYAPNTRSRLLDGEGRISGLSNNYARMSFNFGPTLLSWMEERTPEVLAGIVEGDRQSRERHGGHGNALAQVYSHPIMPLAGERDKRTQIAWGLADFRRRFGRDAAGMWLAETAVDTATLEALAEAGLAFTILAPRQAKRWRKSGGKDWTAITDGIDPSRAYRCTLPSGKSIALFFYDGHISQQVAFERLLDSGEKFLGRLLSGFDDARQHAQLMHIATDGESYGHHHAFGDMALAYVLDMLDGDPHVRLTNYGEFLELHPPEWEVEIHENSSWSCVHGVERWRADCGCRMRGDWHQRWRQPLRQALDWLKARLDVVFAKSGAKVFRDPWAARDDYIRVLLDRSPNSIRNFFRRHARAAVDDALVRRGLTLLEMQRHGLLMFTSCGWFFDEPSGLETTQCLRYAARAVQLAGRLDAPLEEDFVGRLEPIPSNLPQFADGRTIWEEHVRPSQVNLTRVLAHQAISLVFRTSEPPRQVYAFNVETRDHEVHSRAPTHLAAGRLRVRSRLTWNAAEAGFVVLHYGGLDFHAVLCEGPPPANFDDFRHRLAETYAHGSMADVTAMVVREFEGRNFRLGDLFAEEQRRIVGIVLADRFEDYQRVFARLAQQDDDVLARLGQMRFPVPKPLRAAASAYLDYALREEIEALGEKGTGPFSSTDGSRRTAKVENGPVPFSQGDVGRIEALYRRGRAWGYQPQKDLLAAALAGSLEEALAPLARLTSAHYPGGIEGGSTESLPPQLTGRVARLLDAARLLDIELDLWQAQNLLLDAHTRLSADAPSVAQQELAHLAAMLNMNPALVQARPPHRDESAIL